MKCAYCNGKMNYIEYLSGGVYEADRYKCSECKSYLLVWDTGEISQDKIWKEDDEMQKTVCIDAGHYRKYNRCPANPNYYESEVMWILHLLQKKYLEQLGIKVITTRTDQNKDLELYSRGATSKGCDLFISNHSNAVGSGMNETVDYVAVYHLTDDKNVQCDDISKKVANKIAPVIAEVMGVSQGYKVLTRLSDYDSNKDGVMNDNYYGVLNGARLVGTPGLIIEHSFHTNSKAVLWLLDSNNLDKLAKAEAECIASYLLGKTVTLDIRYQLQKKLRIRSKASVTSKSIGTVEAGTIVTFDKIKGNWGYSEKLGGWLAVKHCEVYDENKKYGTGTYIALRKLRVRQAASLSSKQIGIIKKGEEFTTVLINNRIWAYHNKHRGYVPLKYCKLKSK